MIACVLAAFAAFVVNEDNDHFFKLDSSWMNRDGLVRYAQEVLRGKVTHFSMCVNGQRTSYGSKTWEPIWTGIDEPARPDTATRPDGTHDRWAVNAKILFDAGLDPYAVWIDECHKRDVEAWVSMRMNDVHFSDVTNFFRNTTFCKTRRDLWVDPNPKDWFGHALDYAEKEARDYNFAQVREMLWRWDADGIEVDWMRSPPFFRSSEARANAHFITEFMRAVRAEAGRVTAKRGRKMKVIARVGFDVAKSLDQGLDVRQWLREGLVDAIVPSNLFFPDPTIPVDEWLALVKENAPDVQVFPCVNCHHHKSVESIRKAASPYDGTSVSGIYLFNAPYVGKRDTDGRTFSEDVFGILCREGVSFPSEDFTLSAEVDCASPAGRERLLEVPDVFALDLRKAGEDPALAKYDKSIGNYLPWPAADGNCFVLEAVIPRQTACRQVLCPDEFRFCRVGVPLACLKDPYGRHRIRLTYARTRWRLEVDGTVADEDFLVGPLSGFRPTEAKAGSSRLRSWSFGAADRIDEPDAKPVAGPIQYWTTPDFNGWVGDVVPISFKGRFHVFYLKDRRHHRGKAGAGGHYFAHISSDDLVSWTEHPTVTPIEDWYMSAGTGTAFVRDGRLVLTYGIHATRFFDQEDTTEPAMLEAFRKTGVVRGVDIGSAGKVPLGATWASSSDGIRFTPSRRLFHTTQNPGVVPEPDGTFRLTTGYFLDSGATGVFVSKDFDTWTKSDEKPVLSGDCPCPFEWNGYRYLVQGFDGFATSRTGEPLVKRPASEFYDGLNVPMVAEWNGGRRILVGWVRHPVGWGGWLVFRELVQRSDGTLGTVWLKETPPPAENVTERLVPAGSDFTVRLGTPDGAHRLEFKVDAKKGVAYAADVGQDGKLAPFDSRPVGRGFRISDIRGLDRDYRVRLVVRYDRKADATLLDAEIAGDRTLIVCRAGRFECQEPFIQAAPSQAKPAAVSHGTPANLTTKEVLAKGFTVTLQVDLSRPALDAELLYEVGPVRLTLRPAGKDKSLADYDRRFGNYLNWSLHDGTCPVLEATIADKAARVGIPLGCLERPDGVHAVTLDFAPVRWSICVDDHVDEAFPVPACPVVWPPSASEKVHSARVKEAAFVTPARKDVLPPVPAARMIAEPIQYWTPRGHNTWVGDVAPAYLNGKLHVFYLIDRRHHSGGMGTGRHQFAHLSSDDLLHWVEHPLAVPIREDWQTVGTGTPFLKDGKVAIAFGWHTSRYPQRKGKPIGGTYAISDDGINFVNSGVMISDAQNPSIYNLADGRYELVTSYGGSIGIFRSQDLLKWDLYDAKLPFRGDCPSLFDMNGHRYLLQGFTNMGYSADGRPGSFVNWTNEPDALYEGLSVPMVTKWKDDRRLYIGWMNHLYGWGGWLVFREVIAYPDGHLGLKWVPEILPPTPPREYAVKGGEPFRLKLTSEKGRADLIFSVDPVRKEASFGDDVQNLTWKNPRFADNFKVGGVRGVDKDYVVRLVVHYDAKANATIFDAEIAGQRTLICRREGRWR